MSDEQIGKALKVQARRLNGDGILFENQVDWNPAEDGEHKLILELEQEHGRHELYTELFDT